MSATTFIEASHPEHATDVREELLQLAQNIAGWQERTSPRMSNEAMIKRFRGLGSSKTYRRLVNGDTDFADLTGPLSRYRGVWKQIQEMSGSDGREEIYSDLTPTFEVGMAVSQLLPQRGNERIVLVEGPTGGGKTKALEYVASIYPGQTVWLEATEAWSSLNVMMGDFLVALGLYKDTPEDRRRMPASKGARLQEVITDLKQSRRVILLDEGHHMVAGGLNLLKGILNQSDSVLVIACIDTLWTKLAAKSWREASQLVFNRLYERVRLAPPTADDVEYFLTRRVSILAGTEWKKACPRIAEFAENSGAFAFLRRVASAANAMADQPTSADLVKIGETLKQSLRTR